MEEEEATREQAVRQRTARKSGERARGKEGRKRRGGRQRTQALGPGRPYGDQGPRNGEFCPANCFCALALSTCAIYVFCLLALAILVLPTCLIAWLPAAFGVRDRYACLSTHVPPTHLRGVQQAVLVLLNSAIQLNADARHLTSVVARHHIERGRGRLGLPVGGGGGGLAAAAVGGLRAGARGRGDGGGGGGAAGGRRGGGWIRDQDG